MGWNIMNLPYQALRLFLYSLESVSGLQVIAEVLDRPAAPWRSIHSLLARNCWLWAQMSAHVLNSRPFTCTCQGILCEPHSYWSTCSVLVASEKTSRHVPDLVHFSCHIVGLRGVDRPLALQAVPLSIRQDTERVRLSSAFCEDPMVLGSVVRLFIDLTLLASF